MTVSKFNDHDQALVDIQCNIQLCETEKEFEQFKQAYISAKELAYSWLGHKTNSPPVMISKLEILDHIMEWGGGLDDRNVRFRKVPIYIGGEARRNQDRINDQMDHFCQVFAEYFNCPEGDEVEDVWSVPYMKVNPDRLYEWFERIHPFMDGNGRTGHLLWAFAMTRLNGVWPRTLPSNVFDDPRLRNHIYVHGEHNPKWDIRSDVWDFDTGSWL